MSILSRLTEGLRASSQHWQHRLRTLFLSPVRDATWMAELEEMLLLADVGVTLTDRALKSLDRHAQPAQWITSLETLFLSVLQPKEAPFCSWPRADAGPHTVVVVGPNGAGKTTTIGKMAWYGKRQGRRMRLVAADTFRAAAVEQLQVWGEDIPVTCANYGQDAASVAFRGLEEARKAGDEIVLLDTAGRLHTQQPLMDALAKIMRTLDKGYTQAGLPCSYETLLVLDGTTGQNGIVQAEKFQQAISISSLVMTKLDGTAKGGILLQIVEKTGIPVCAVGVGEDPEDLQPFQAEAFVQSLLGCAHRAE